MRKKFLFVFFYVFASLTTAISSNAYDSDPQKFITEIVDEAKEILIAGNDKAYKPINPSKKPYQRTNRFDTPSFERTSPINQAPPAKPSIKAHKTALKAYKLAPKTRVR